MKVFLEIYLGRKKSCHEQRRTFFKKQILIRHFGAWTFFQDSSSCLFYHENWFLPKTQVKASSSCFVYQKKETFVSRSLSKGKISTCLNLSFFVFMLFIILSEWNWIPSAKEIGFPAKKKFKGNVNVVYFQYWSPFLASAKSQYLNEFKK